MTTAPSPIDRILAACVLALAMLPVASYGQRPARGGHPPGGPGVLRGDERRQVKRDMRREMKGKSEGQEPGPRPGDGPEALGRGALIGRALGALSLTPAQRQSLRQIRGRSDERMRQHGRRVLDLRRQVDELLFGPASSMDLARERAGELSRTIGERTTDRTLVELAVFETLTPQQRAEFRAMREAQRERLRAAVAERMRARRQAPEGAPADAGADVPEPGAEPDVDEPEAMPPPGGLPPAGSGPGREGRMRPQRGAPLVEMLTALNLTPGQAMQLRRLRRQRAPVMRQSAERFRGLQRDVDDALVADSLDAGRIRALATDLGKADAEREFARFESEAGIRAILTDEQASQFRALRRRGPGAGPGPDVLPPAPEPATRPVSKP